MVHTGKLVVNKHTLFAFGFLQSVPEMHWDIFHSCDSNCGWLKTGKSLSLRCSKVAFVVTTQMWKVAEGFISFFLCLCYGVGASPGGRSGGVRTSNTMRLWRQLGKGAGEIFPLSPVQFIHHFKCATALLGTTHVNKWELRDLLRPWRQTVIWEWWCKYVRARST